MQKFEKVNKNFKTDNLPTKPGFNGVRTHDNETI